MHFSFLEILLLQKYENRFQLSVDLKQEIMKNHVGTTECNFCFDEIAVCSALLARNLNDYIIKSDTTFTLIISILLKGQISKCYAKI